MALHGGQLIWVLADASIESSSRTEEMRSVSFMLFFKCIFICIYHIAAVPV